MNRLVWFAAAQIFAGSLWAQTVVSTHIYADPNCTFFVDGVKYTNAAVFLWPEGSKHILAPGGTNQYTTAFRVVPGGSWTDNLGSPLDGPVLAITAHRDKQWYRMSCSIECRIELHVPVAERMACIPGPEYGKVYVAGGCYDKDAEIWQSYPSVVKIDAYPPRGYVFSGWTTLPMVGQSYQGQDVCPGVLAPDFDPAAQVTLQTEPRGLMLLADRTAIKTPYSLDWALGSKHQLAPVSPQLDEGGGMWLWDAWAHGGSENQVYATPSNYTPMTLTAKFVPGVRVGFTTVPAGLKLSVDGRDDWPNLNFVWRVGSKHTIAAPAEQYSAKGRKFGFREWATGGAVEQEFVADGSRTGLTASYDIFGQLTLQATPSQVGMTVDGAPCTTPCTVDRRAGATVKVVPPPSVAMNENSRLDFQGWADGGSRERTWTAGADALTLVAGYQVMHRLSAAADPAEGASFRFEPASPDGFYPEGTDVRVLVEPKPGYKFRWWEGSLSGTSVSGMVSAWGPVRVRAILERVPYIPPAGVRNAAGQTPEAGVAAGSIITISGGSLAPAYERGPDTPLEQSIAGVTVQVADRVLPLFFVSPEQINAQLLSDLPEGEYTLKVRGDSQPDASAKFTIQRNAPGLFARTGGTRAYALATHQDGTAITPDSPATRGETITLLGTGLGPYEGLPPDGFVIPQGFELKLVDAVEILIGDRAVPAVSATAAAGYVGMTAVRLKITDELPSDTAAEVRLRVSGKESNTVVLPLK